MTRVSAAIVVLCLAGCGLTPGGDSYEPVARLEPVTVGRAGVLNGAAPAAETPVVLAGYQDDGPPPLPEIGDGTPLPAGGDESEDAEDAEAETPEPDEDASDEDTPDDDTPDDDTPDDDTPDGYEPLPAAESPLTLPEPAGGGLGLDEVIRSVYGTYPLLAAAITERTRATGERVAASGAFDTNLDLSSINQPLGFYENYRHDAVVSRNLYEGGSAFAKYRVGRGEFEPWYFERVTHEGGEVSAGIIRPLKRGRDIDARRAELWRAAQEQIRVEPLIRSRLILFVQDAAAAYWNWVAAGLRVRLAERLVDLAEERVRQVRERVAEGDLDPPAEPENERLLLTRHAALLAAEGAFERAAATLSLYYRDEFGNPILPTADLLPGDADLFPVVPDPRADLAVAVANRPELEVILAERRQASITLAEARNRLLPRLDAQGLVKQDFGAQGTSTDDKGELELEASVLFNLPVQRRKAKGDILRAQAKLSRLASERRLAEDRVLADLLRAAAAIEAAAAQLRITEQSVELAAELVDVAQERFRLGDADLLEVTIREQQLAEAAESVIAARLALGLAEAEYRAALATDRLP